jgi:hypothetical protein
VLTSSVEMRGSDHLREFVECRGKGQSGTCIDPEFVVSSPQVLDEGMPSDHDAGGAVPFEASHRSKSCLESPMVSFDPVVGVLGGVVECSRQELGDHADQGVGPVSGDLGRRSMGADRIGEEPCRNLQVSLLGHEHVDDLPVLVDRSVHVPPGPGDLHVGLIDEPVTTHSVAPWSSRVDEQGCESLNPPVQVSTLPLFPTWSFTLFPTGLRDSFYSMAAPFTRRRVASSSLS